MEEREFKELRISFVPMDYAACGLYRVRNPFYALYLSCKACLQPAGTFPAGSDVIYTQRLCNDATMDIMKGLRDKGARIICDFDDCIWEPLPKYNKCPVRWEDNRKGMEKNLADVCERVTCTNEYLKKKLTEFMPEDRITVVPNCLDSRMWLRDFTQPGKGFLYAGSPTHWTRDDYGDFPKGLVDYLKDKLVRVMGVAPPFLNVSEVKPWCPVDWYPMNFIEMAKKSAFVLAPLVDNEFNKCKSDLKYIECCATGRVCLCSDVETYSLAHPYQKIPLDVTPTTMKYIVERASEHYAEILKHQYNILNTRWVRAEPYIELFK